MSNISNHQRCMKKIRPILLFLCLTFLINVQGQLSGGGEANPGLKTNTATLEAFQDMRFGMFIHWGPVSLRGTEIGWSRGREVPIAEYDQLYTEFDPVLFDPAKWVKTAKDAGMKYVVLTTKHHDGFSLWDTEQSDYNSMNSPYGKDIVKQLADECKKQGIVFGAYYSIADWHHPDNPMVYPPDKSDTGEKDLNDPDTKARMDRYIRFMKNQLKELIDSYDPALIWFDGQWEWVWTHGAGMDLYAYLRSLKEDLLINDRVDKGHIGMDRKRIVDQVKYAGDYLTPEQRIGTFNMDEPWETCMTIAAQWAWKPNDQLKSRKECIQTLVQTVGGDGNLLFNVGPILDGRIEQRQIDRLKEMGDWLKINGEAVYGTRGGPYLPKDYMVSTRKGNRIFLHVLKNPEEGSLHLPFPKGTKIKKSYLLDGNAPVEIQREKEFITLKLSAALPDADVSVLVLELDRPAMELGLIQRLNF